jgi:hypothetical protein
MVLIVIDMEIIRNRLIYLLVPAAVIAMVRGVRPFVMGRLALVGLALGSGIYYFGWLKREIAYMLVPYHNYFAIALNLHRSTDSPVPEAEARRASDAICSGLPSSLSHSISAWRSTELPKGAQNAGVVSVRHSSKPRQACMCS